MAYSIPKRDLAPHRAGGAAPGGHLLIGTSTVFQERFGAVSRIAPLINRVWNTAVFWTWMFNGLRLANGVLLVIFLNRLLSPADLGLYALFFQFTGFMISFDQTFAVTIARFVGYALSGVQRIQGIGLAPEESEKFGPNVLLLGQLLYVGQLLYRLLGLGILLLLGVFGTLLLRHDFGKGSNPTIAWVAWGITVFSSCLELYTGYALCYLRGLNKMLISSRLSTIIYGFKLLLSISLLLAKFKLLAVPIATLVTGVLQRLLARHYLLRNLPPGVRMDSTGSREILRHVWPSSWRLGITLLSLNVMIVGFGLIIDRTQGLAGVPPYHFSQQILYGVCVSMATVWTFVKWPQICLQRAVGDFAGLQRVVWQRLWLQCLTYVGLAALFIFVGPLLLKWFAPDKQLLPRVWLIVLALYAFLDMHYGFWTTLISTENRIPSMWAAAITNFSTLGLAFWLAKFTDVGWGAFVIAPLACGAVFNYWFWPGYGARGIGTTWLRLMFQGPSAAAAASPGARSAVAA